MKWRGAFLLLMIFIGFSVAILKFADVRSVLVNNNATYLINQGKFAEAETRLKSLLDGNPSDPKAVALLVESLMSQGEYGQASAYLEKLPSAPQSAFVKGVCHYEQNNEDMARTYFRLALDTDAGRLSAVQRQISQLAVNPQCVSILVDGDEDKGPSGNLTEQMVENSLTGRAFFERWDYAHCSSSLQRAFLQGDRNAVSYLRLCESCAICREFTNAEYYADRTIGRNLYEDMDGDLSAAVDQFTTGAISLDDMVSRNILKVRFAESIVWSKAKNAMKNCPEEMPHALICLDDFLDLYPARLQAAVLKGELLESMGRDREAYLAYENVAQQQVGYSILLHMKALAGDIPKLNRMESAILHSPGVKAVLSATDMASSSAVLLKDVLSFYKSGTGEVNFSVACSGQYQVSLIAKCDRAFGLGAYLRVGCDNDFSSNIYIAREGWDCYPIYMPLKQGNHSLEIEYLNNSERLASTDEDRNFYLKSVIISSWESREIERAGKP